MKLLVTGHKGFIGNSLLNSLIGKDVQVVGYDLKDDNDVRDYMNLYGKSEGVDVIVHLAARISVPESHEFPKMYTDHNINGSFMVKKVAEQRAISRVVFSSSAAVESPESSPYAITKQAGESIFKGMGHSPFPEILRFFNVYGPNQSSAYAGVITKFMYDIETKGEVTIFGDGKQTRDFVHIDDVCQAITRATLEGRSTDDRHPADPISIGSGTSISINELADLMFRLYDKPTKILRKPKKKEVRHSKANIRRAKKLLNYEPKVSLEEGLKDLIERRRQ